MALGNIRNLKIPAADDAILFLWATQPKIREALAVIESWGFEYKSGLVWVKDRIGTGYYVRGQHELLLIATRGKIPVPEESNRPPSVFQARRMQHSAKPNIAYEIIERMYGGRKYLELFARAKRRGWTSWGQPQC
jgi:N6-adenosine-specific RNA methylase IME4